MIELYKNISLHNNNLNVDLHDDFVDYINKIPKCP
jgi:hypothetical protein